MWQDPALNPNSFTNFCTASADEIMLITSAGVLVRTRVSEIREMGRATQGVTLINIDQDSYLSGVRRVVESDADDEEGDDAGADGSDPDASGDGVVGDGVTDADAGVDNDTDTDKGESHE